MTSLRDVIVPKILEERDLRLRQIEELLQEVREAESLLSQMGISVEATEEAAAWAAAGDAAVAAAAQDVGKQRKPAKKSRRTRAKRPVRRMGKSLSEWDELLRREYGGTSREFTAQDVMKLTNIPETRGNKQSTWDLFRILPDVERVGNGKYRYTKAPAVTIAGPGSLAAAQAAYKDSKEEEPKVQAPPRGVPVPGTGHNLISAIDKDIRNAIAPALRAGYVVSMSGSGHFKLTHPKDRSKNFGVSASPSDKARVIDQIRQEMRALQIPGVK